MLRKRIITAVLLLCILVPAVLSSNRIFFVLVSGILVCAAAWEWALLSGFPGITAIFFGLGFGAVCAGLWMSGVVFASLAWLWLGIGAVWVLLASWLLRVGSDRWLVVPRGIRLAGGLVGLCAAWLALVQARAIGVNFLFSVLALVWVADIAAYFSGRLLGSRFIARRLAPRISPGKTWEGVIGAFVVVMAVAFSWRSLDSGQGLQSQSLYSHLGAVGHWFLALSVVFLTTMSVAGDLLESLFKRAAGVKDSSGLLPGHGGVLDRIDALLPVLPLAMLLCSN